MCAKIYGIVRTEGGKSMGEKKIEILPANRETVQQNRMLRAAAYCRVSTSMEEQKSSYESQLRYYEAYIGRKP